MNMVIKVSATNTIYWGKKTRFSSSPNFPTKNDGNQNSSAAAATANATCLSICALDEKGLWNFLANPFEER